MESEELDFLILKQLAVGRNRHGWGIAQSINDRQGTTYKAKKFYPILDGMHQQGLLSKEICADTLAGPPKYNYGLTDLGQRRLQELRESIKKRAQNLLREVEELGEGENRRAQ